MEVIAVVESDDYGPAAILDPSEITISRFDDFYIGATRCVFTSMPITCELSEEVALKLMKKGVRCLNLSSEKVILENEAE